MAGMERPVDPPDEPELSRPVRRAGRFEIAGRHRARMVALRAGTALRDARLAAGLNQAEVGRRAGVSQVHVSRLERGAGAEASLATWSRVASAVGEQLVAFLERVPGADQPRDLEHLRRQSALITIAAKGGWQGRPEMAVDPGNVRSRSIDVVLVRPRTREAVVAEIWDWFDDVGAGLRGLDAKVAALTAQMARQVGAGAPTWKIGALYLVRDTRRNRRLVAELPGLFAARFRGSSDAWSKALTDPSQELPSGAGFVWSDRTGSALRPSRLRV